MSVHPSPWPGPPNSWPDGRRKQFFLLCMCVCACFIQVRCLRQFGFGCIWAEELLRMPSAILLQFYAKVYNVLRTMATATAPSLSPSLLCVCDVCASVCGTQKRMQYYMAVLWTAVACRCRYESHPNILVRLTFIAPAPQALD